MKLREHLVSFTAKRTRRNRLRRQRETPSLVRWKAYPPSGFQEMPTLTDVNLAPTTSQAISCPL
jgi:hypothetical protein